MGHNLLYIVFIFVLVTIVSKAFSPPGVRRSSTLANNPTGSLGSAGGNRSFVAMQYYALVLNRTFRVTITDKYLCGARVASAIATPSPNPGPEWQDPEFYVNSYFDKQYEGIDPESQEFLAKDKANFRIARGDISRIDYVAKKWGMGNVPHSGRLLIATKNGKKLELILLGKQDHGAIVQRIHLVRLR